MRNKKHEDENFFCGNGKSKIGNISKTIRYTKEINTNILKGNFIVSFCLEPIFLSE